MDNEARKQYNLPILERIEDLRKANGIPKMSFYQQTQTSASAFSQWKAGATSPKRSNLARIAECLDTTVAYLEYGDEKPTPGVEDGLTPDQRELIALLPQLSPQMIAVLLATAKAMLQSQDNL